MTHISNADLQKILSANPDLTLVTDGQRTTIQRKTPVVRMSERDLQAAVVEECERRAITDPRYNCIFAIPNGQYRQGARMEPGLKAGVPDLMLAYVSGEYAGLFIELKCDKNKPSQNQREWIERLTEQGYKCVIVWDSVEAVMQIIENYLEGL